MTQTDPSRFDIVVVGAGPAGLCFAASMLPANLNIALVEQQPRSVLEDPPFDGREIALTQPSVQSLSSLGAWSKIPESEISPLRSARVSNGPSAYFMDIDRPSGKYTELGYLVPNHLIRRATYECIQNEPRISLLSEEKVTGIHVAGDSASVTLKSGRTLTTSLVVAADTRFSETRAAMGIPASMSDFGKSMMVCRMEHTEPHHHIAREWFDYGQTLALLPMNGDVSSVVITLPNNEMNRLREMGTIDFNLEMERRFDHRMGRMELISERFNYRLVAVYPARFTAKRYALIGDAAVGMHPVTAHGFNLGLLGVTTLAREILAAVDRGKDIAARDVLARYERKHRLATLPLYLATNAIVRLYTNEALPIRLARDALLRLGNNVLPFRKALSTAVTMGTSGT